MSRNGGSIVCHVDHALDPERTVAIATRVAEGLRERLVLTAVAPSAGDRWREADERLEDALAVVEQGVEVATRIERGDPARRLAEVVADEHGDLLVVSSAGHGPLLARLGNEPHARLMASRPCPVVVVPASSDAPAAPDGPVVCGADGSSESAGAVAVAARLARALGVSITLTHVSRGLVATPSAGIGMDHALISMAAADSARLAVQRALDAAPGNCQIELVIEAGDAADKLIEVTERRHAQLIVVGPRGLGPVRSALLGSVSAELLGSSPVAVVLA